MENSSGNFTVFRKGSTLIEALVLVCLFGVITVAF